MRRSRSIFATLAQSAPDPQFDTGNHLFRLEVHDAPSNRPETSGALTVPRDPGALLVTLKWSHDNGIEVPIAQADALLTDSAFDTAIFELTDPTRENPPWALDRTADTARRDAASTRRDRSSSSDRAHRVPAGLGRGGHDQIALWV